MRAIEHRTDIASTAPADPLALDPLGPVAVRAGAGERTFARADPLALDPLSPIVDARPRAGDDWAPSSG